MPTTPTADVETFSFADLLVAVSPFVVGVGVLSGILAAVVVLPVALWTGGRFSPPSWPPGKYGGVPAAIGGVGLFASAWVEFVFLRGPPEPGGWLLLRQVLVAGTLAAGVRYLAYRGVDPGTVARAVPSTRPSWSSGRSSRPGCTPRCRRSGLSDGRGDFSGHPYSSRRCPRRPLGARGRPSACSTPYSVSPRSSSSSGWSRGSRPRRWSTPWQHGRVPASLRPRKAGVDSSGPRPSSAGREHAVPLDGGRARPADDVVVATRPPHRRRRRTLGCRPVRDVPRCGPGGRRSGLWCYAAFVVVWTAFVGALYAVWL